MSPAPTTANSHDEAATPSAPSNDGKPPASPTTQQTNSPSNSGSTPPTFGPNGPTPSNHHAHRRRHHSHRCTDQLGSPEFRRQSWVRKRVVTSMDSLTLPVACALRGKGTSLPCLTPCGRQAAEAGPTPLRSSAHPTAPATTTSVARANRAHQQAPPRHPNAERKP